MPRCQLSGASEHVRRAAVSMRSLHTLHEPCLCVSSIRLKDTDTMALETVCIYPGIGCQHDVSPGDDLLPRLP